VINAEGSGRTRLTEIPDNDHWPPTWSPDSTRIAFTSDGTDRLGEVYVMNSDGTGLTKLTDAPSGMLGSEPPAVMFTAWRP
jgi:TolB protein